MPSFSVSRSLLFSLLGESYSNATFDQICFDFGIEMEWSSPTLDKLIESKKEEIEKAKNEGRTYVVMPVEEVEKLPDIEYKIEVGANRYDLLCTEGLVRALRLFLKKDKVPPQFSTTRPTSPLKMIVKAETKQVRPYVVCATLRNITFTDAAYDSFIALQEKLHQNICKKRKLVAIGTHDLDTLEGPFTYEALPPASISFVPLNQTKTMTGEELMTFYKGSHLEPYLPIIKDSPVYPVIYDKQRRVLSLPPIINSNHSKIKRETKNIFIECTALDLTKANIVLNTMVTSFAQYSSTPFVAEQVEVVDSDGQSKLYPDLSSFDLDVSIPYINSGSGLDLPPQTVCELLVKTGLVSKIKNDKTITVTVPVWRSDIFHACDIMEDLAVAYGFNTIVDNALVPQTPTIGAQQPLNKFTDLLRLELALAGYCEVLNFAMSTTADNFQKLKRVDDGKTAVKVDSTDFPTIRTNLLAGLLKVVYSNKSAALPLSLFEVGDVVLLDESKDVGTRNQRKLAALYCDTHSGFEVIHGLLHRVMQMLDVPLKDEKHNHATSYFIKASNDKTLFEGRQAHVYYKEKNIGYLGVVHPDVLKAYEIPYPCSVLEIDIEQFL